jgi:CheY-like chemotaxis protein
VVDRSQAYPKPLQGVRIVIVEDDADSREALRFLLDLNGADVVSASSAEAGRAALHQLRPHVLISDLSMPNEDGFSLLASVRAWPAEDGGTTPAVAFTALSPTDARQRADQAGFQAFLRKPHDVAQLVPVVLRLIPSTL